MKKYLFVLLFMFISNSAFAGYNVCYDQNGENLIVTGSNPRVGCLYFYDGDMAEYNRVKTLYQTVGLKFMKVVNGVVEEMSQAEKDAILQAEADAQALAQTTSDNNLDVTLKEAFVVWLAVYNSKVPTEYQVTGAELIQKIKDNR